jgi:hypothetical protein
VRGPKIEVIVSSLSVFIAFSSTEVDEFEKLLCWR